LPVDSVVVGPESLRGAVLPALRQDYASMPVVMYGPIRPDDARALLEVQRRHLAAVLVEGVDEPVLGSMVLRAGLVSRRLAMLAPLAESVGYGDRFRRHLWQLLAESAEMSPGTARLADSVGVR